ncbi:Gldg family protein [Pseudobacter ginsenosidimutans]|uniref:ABC-2 type transport system permease protein n=1 Tax=Pseudobacter ginsenosidimutans TaxID=661488 RepID=A0A4Q7N4H0_9BACT|nr:Gldg family protein [Pseudobacter ginsenosidimutans]QEC44435.1 ABC transporter permease subunit [Pseudobacter ginsenosidimutans]RZS75906.1 ABC-2 type transport system permease protein [Pseudobacter ginsenosidimutans]
MKIYLKIARAELRYLFYSPVAWFVLLVFYTFAAYLFFFPQESKTIVQEEILDTTLDWMGVAPGLYGDMIGPIVKQLTDNLYLFIPLLTMGVINRETTSGSIKLLYSSPIRTREIVLGKYLGMVCFNAFLLLGFGVVLATASFTISDPETGWMISALFGMFLIANAYTAIGIFISSLTNYQIVAAALTFVVFFAMNQLSGLWQQYDLVRDLTYSFSLKTKAIMLLRGMLTSRDIIYFLLIAALFLFFTLIRLKSMQESKTRKLVFSRYALAFLAVVMLSYLSSRPGYILYHDLTKNKNNTLHPVLQDVVKKLDGSPLTVTLYANLFHPRAYAALPQNRVNYFLDLWEEYIRFYPNLKFKFEYYYDINEGDSSLYKKYPGKSMDEIAAIRCEILDIRKSLFKKPSEMKNMAELRDEELRMLMELDYKGRKTILRAFDDGKTWPKEENIAGSLMRLVRDNDVKTTFLTGHIERSPYRFTPKDFGGMVTNKDFRNSLINKGVDADTISIADKEIPDNLDLLVVADPRTPYNEAELNRLSKYIDAGGNAIVLTEPGRQQFLDPILKKLGVQVDHGTIVRIDKDEKPTIFSNRFTDEANLMADELYWQYYNWYRKWYLGGWAMNDGAASLNVEPVNGFKPTPILIMPGDQNTWIENGLFVVDSAAPVFSEQEGDIRKPAYNIVVSLTRTINNKEQRIIVAGDADFMNTKRVPQGKIWQALYSWGLNNQYPVYANKRMPPDRFFSISNKTAGILLGIYVYLIPAALLLIAAIILVRRKRK